MIKKPYIGGIDMNQNVRFGKPVIVGTRIPVEIIVGKIAAGMTTDEVMQEYDLTKQQVLAALKYASHVVALDEIATP